MVPRGAHRAKPRTSARTYLLGVAAAAILAVTLVFLGVEFARAVNTTRTLTAPAQQLAEDNSAAQVSCLQAMTRRLLPEGTHVYIGPTWGSPQYRGKEQELIEYITPWLVPVHSADWHVSLGTGPCYGLGIEVKAR